MSRPTFFSAEPFAAGQQVTLGEDAAHHMRVRRLTVGTPVALLDGQGTRGEGVLIRLAKRNATVDVASALTEAAPRPVHLILPVADKERMLWLAEKTAELGAASWRPVQFRRSRSVASRGEGPMFTQKVAARMTGAIEQSGSTWRPTIFPEATVERAIAAAPDGVRIVLDGGGTPLATMDLRATVGGGYAPTENDDAFAMHPVVIVVGPEGGIEQDELDAFVAAGFKSASIGKSVLRFETAAVAALGIVKSLIAGVPE
ncbi:MAG: RsmE family RNA methyltransferase [Gemmatimonadetes bacterium]|nr:RsmE family RNA methyltransferase [Gemmatimonadota bacterium]